MAGPGPALIKPLVALVRIYWQRIVHPEAKKGISEALSGGELSEPGGRALHDRGEEEEVPIAKVLPPKPSKVLLRGGQAQSAVFYDTGKNELQVVPAFILKRKESEPHG